MSSLEQPFHSKKYSFPCTLCWSSNPNRESIFLNVMCSWDCSPEGDHSALHWVISGLSLQLVPAPHIFKTTHEMSTSKNSEGKTRVTHIVQLSLHVGHVPHLEETDTAEAPPRQWGRASAAFPSPSSCTPNWAQGPLLTML